MKAGIETALPRQSRANKHTHNNRRTAGCGILNVDRVVTNSEDYKYLQRNFTLANVMSQ
jgi:hypothetical protein